jgi:Raf kinase inhibitor-like YbhB/YbcL family protein
MEMKMKVFNRISSLLLGLAFSMSANADDFSLATNAFLDTGALPVLYTCDGKDVSPQLSWSNPPDKTQSFVLIAEDRDAPNGTFYHWVVYNLPASAKELAEGTVKFPGNTLLGVNSWDKNQYNGPCPPKGSAHTYYFTLYALDATVKLPAGADGKTVLASIKDHIIKKAELSTVYSRWLK